MERSTHLLGIAALLAAATSCSMLPEDHAFRDLVGRGVSGAVDSVRGVERAIHKGNRDLAALTTDLANAPGATARELNRLQGSGTMLAESSAHRLQRFLPNTTNAIRGATDRGVRRVGHLTGAPERIGLNAERNLASLKGAVVSTPSLLRLDRTPMASADDPERSTEIVPTSRRRSWLERMIDRISL